MAKRRKTPRSHALPLLLTSAALAAAGVVVLGSAPQVALSSGHAQTRAAHAPGVKKHPTPGPSPSTATTSTAASPSPSPSPSFSASTVPSPSSAPTSTAPSPGPVSSAPPPVDGYVTTAPVGAWSSLPGDAQCAAQVHRSSWEPRPDNQTPNHTMPDPAAVHAAFRARPVGLPHWDDWLLPRVDGQFTGTTDEIIQWAACKWGIADNVLRAVAEQESTWYQAEVYPSGRPVSYYGAGDFFTSRSAASDVFCNAISRYGYDYMTAYSGLCPQTFSIAGIKSWQDPSWGQMADNQNGTFPFNRDSTAFALDYYAAHLRGVYEGWETWLRNGYQAGDLWGAVGSWYSGDWHSAAADRYAGQVQTKLANHDWLAPGWPSDKPPCSPTYGCPQGS